MVRWICSPPPLAREGRVGALDFRDRRALRLIRCRLEPRVADLFCHRFGCGAQAHHQDVGVIPFASTSGRLRIAAEGGPDAGNLVGRDRHARPGPAEEHALLAGTRGDPLPHFPPDVDPVHRVAVQRAVEFDLDAHPAQVIDYRIGDRCPFVAAYRDLHAHCPE